MKYVAVCKKHQPVAGISVCKECLTDVQKSYDALLKLLELYKKHFDLGELYRIANNFPHLAEKMGECISELETAEYEYERTINGK